MYICDFCKHEIKDVSDGLVIKVQSLDQSIFERCVIVHIGECDDQMEMYCREQGKNANSSMRLEFLTRLDLLEEYCIKGKVSFDN